MNSSCMAIDIAKSNDLKHVTTKETIVNVCALYVGLCAFSTQQQSGAHSDEILVHSMVMSVP